MTVRVRSAAVRPSGLPARAAGAARPGGAGPGRPRRARRAAAVAVAAAAALAWAGPAHAVGYRYWSFWERDGGQWVYATQGPATARPGDGDVQGFRFSVSENSGDAAQPRGEAGFDAICGGVPPEEGTKRVALVLDFGTAADAPSGATPPGGRTECARVPQDATSAEALAAVAKPLRYNASALLCAIAGYPARGCGEQVSGSPATPGGTDGTEDVECTDGTVRGTGTDGTERADRADGPDGSARTDPQAGSGGSGDDGGPSVGVFAGAATVLALAAAAWRQSRRRR